MTNQSYKFRGGLSVGFSGATWPNGILEIYHNSLVIHNKLLQKKYELSRDQITKIEPKIYVPLFANGIRIQHTNEKYEKTIYFWHLGFTVKKLIRVLKEYNWLSYSRNPSS